MPKQTATTTGPDRPHWALVVWIDGAYSAWCKRCGWETDTTTVLHVAQLWAREHNENEGGWGG